MNLILHRQRIRGKENQSADSPAITQKYASKKNILEVILSKEEKIGTEVSLEVKENWKESVIPCQFHQKQTL